MNRFAFIPLYIGVIATEIGVKQSQPRERANIQDPLIFDVLYKTMRVIIYTRVLFSDYPPFQYMRIYPL